MKMLSCNLTFVYILSANTLTASMILFIYLYAQKGICISGYSHVSLLLNQPILSYIKKYIPT